MPRGWPGPVTTGPAPRSAPAGRWPLARGRRRAPAPSRRSGLRSAANSDCQAAVPPPVPSCSSRAAPAGCSRQRATAVLGGPVGRRGDQRLDGWCAARHLQRLGPGRRRCFLACCRLGPAATCSVRSRSPVPAKSCQRASTSPLQQRAVPAASVDLGQARLVGAVDARWQLGAQGELVSHLGGQGGHPGAEGVEHAGHGLGQHRDPPVLLLAVSASHSRTGAADLGRQHARR